jgi:hypothetical protein
MNQRSSQFYIKAENKAGALQAIKDLAKDEHQAGSDQFDKNWRYAWVSNKYKNAETLEEALAHWRWHAVVSENNDSGDIVAIDFQGEKLGDEEVLFTAIAPFVEKGSYIEIHGEEDCFWRWVFDGETMTEKYAELVW